MATPRRNPAEAVDPPKVERGQMATYDMAQTAELVEATRGKRLSVAIILAVLCGLRRGEIAALRWREINLVTGQLAVVASAEQTKAGIRYKEPKGGKARTVAMSATVINELRAHRARQAEELLRVGIGLVDDTFVLTRADGMPLQPRSVTHEWVRLLGKTSPAPHSLPRPYDTPMRPTCWRPASIPRSPASALGTPRSGLRWTSIRTSMPGMQADAASRVDAALIARQESRRKRNWVAKR